MKKIKKKPTMLRKQKLQPQEEKDSGNSLGRPGRAEFKAAKGRVEHRTH